MKIITWNVNGIRSRIFNDKTSTQIGKVKDVPLLQNSPMNKILNLDPDVICLQETRCDKIQGARFKIPGYVSYFNESNGEGARGPNRYSGTCIFIKENIAISKIEYNIPDYEDTEGRIIILNLTNTIIVSVYAPNSGTNYENKITFMEAMLEYLNSLSKNVILCGDLNIAKDTHFDKSKVEPSPGFYPHELDFYTDLHTIGFVDATKDYNYTWWDPRTKKIDGIPSARYNNKGWRLDYFLVKGINEVSCKVFKSIGETNPLSSDHAPVLLEY